jgi:hypothetical protein
MCILRSHLLLFLASLKCDDDTDDADLDGYRIEFCLLVKDAPETDLACSWKALQDGTEHTRKAVASDENEVAFIALIFVIGESN